MLLWSSIRSRVWLWGPPLLYGLLIFHFSSESDPLPAIRIAVWDKFLHASEFAGLALLVCRGFRGEGRNWRQALLFALALTSVYGATDEWHQSFVPLRDSTVFDWEADTIGAAAGLVIARVLFPIGDALRLSAEKSR